MKTSLRPLDGQCVWVTRAAHQSGALSARLQALGARVREIATIELVAPDDWGPLDRALANLAQFDWLLFTSPNAVAAFRARLPSTGASPPSARVAAVGPATQAALAALGWPVALRPDRYDATSLARSLIDGYELQHTRLLWPRGNLADESLAEALSHAGARVEAPLAYENRPALLDGPILQAALAHGEADWIAFASGSAFRHLLAALPDARALRHARLASIGPRTSRELRDAGFDVAAEALESTLEGLATAIAASQGP